MSGNDWHTKQGAERLAESIKAHWARKGYAVDITLIPTPFCYAMREEWWSLRSDMVNGMPTRRTGQPKRISKAIRSISPANDTNPNEINAIRNRLTGS